MISFRLKDNKIEEKFEEKKMYHNFNNVWGDCAIFYSVKLNSFFSTRNYSNGVNSACGKTRRHYIDALYMLLSSVLRINALHFNVLADLF